MTRVLNAVVGRCVCRSCRATGFTTDAPSSSIAMPTIVKPYPRTAFAVGQILEFPSGTAGTTSSAIRSKFALTSWQRRPVLFGILFSATRNAES